MKSNMISTLEMAIIDVNSEYLGLSRRLLMENAGKGLADIVWNVYQNSNRSNIIIFAGKGGNGGDGMVAARHLARNVPISLILLGSHQEITKHSTLENWKIIQNMSDTIMIKELQLVKDIASIKFTQSSLIVDAIFGTGIKGDIREPIASVLQHIIKWQKKGAIVLSADTPTGIDPNTGNQSNIFLTPQQTVVFHRQKIGLNHENAGNITILPIGIPPESEAIIGPGNLLALKKRSLWAKKGDSGKVLIIGGNETYSGAPSLAAMGAIQSRSDLVTILAPETVSFAIRSYSPELIVWSYSSSHLTTKDINTELINENDAILLGPGLGRHEETKKAVLEILDLVKELKKPIILDADALKLIDIKSLDSQAILTPHAGEFKILTGISIPSASNDFPKRVQLVKDTLEPFPHLTWIIKGHWDIVINGTNLKINKTGTPLMTRGGTGDVLAGMVTGFVPQTESLFHAACIGAYINGRAGELAEENFSLLYLLDKIPKAISEGFAFIMKD